MDYRIAKDKIAGQVMFLLTIASIFLVIIMAVGLFIKSEPILSQYNLWDLLTESNWRPMEGKFGFLPFLAGTFWCTALAILIALPISLLMAVYLTEYAHRSIRKYVYPLLDILAGLPSVIYGVWGSLLIVPWVSKHVAPLFVEFSSGYTVLAGGSTLLGLLISLPVVFYMNVYLKPNSKFGYVARLAYDTLFGIPSIVYGSFAFTLMVWLGIRASLGGGILVTTLLIVPILIRSMDEVAKTIPQEILDSSYSLGATRIETIGVVLRQIAPAIATATLLSIGRAIGDCAGVMFTAGFSDHIPHGLNQQAATLPLSVFFQLSAPQEDVQNRAYAAAVVLTIIVLILSFGGRFIMSHFSKNKI